MSELSEKPLEAHDLTKCFRDFWGRPIAHAVRGISLSAARGEVVGLLGPNGSGKSTTIRMLLGLLRPTSGDVRLFGLPPTAAAARARIGYLPELSNLHKFLTPREALESAAALENMPRALARERIEEMLNLLGLHARHAADRPVGGFSKGMARRVAIARALLHDPELVVLDEPTSGLDPVGRHEVKEIIRGLAARGKTVLLSSHLLAEVADVCTRVCILVDGVICAEGELASLLADRARVRFTLGDLDEAGIARARDALASVAGVAPEKISIDRPSQTLEEYFLDVLNRTK